jgi:MGT family glycosyltransferase
MTFSDFESVPPRPEGVAMDDMDFVLFDSMLNGAGVAQDVVNTVKADPPDVLVVDCMMGGALAAAEFVDIPTVVLVHVLFQPFVTVWGQFLIDESKARIALGLPAFDEAPTMTDILARASMTVICIPAEFDFPDAPLTAATHYVGPIFAPDTGRVAWAQPWDPDDERTLVLVSLSSTLQDQDRALPPIMEALRDLPVRALLTLGNVVIRGDLSVPPNVAVVDYVPHTAVLGDTSLVICHGGLSTVMAALAHGVPLVCIPQGRDQSFNAERVQSCGVGISLAKDAPPETIAQAIRTVLEDSSYTDSARSFAMLIADAGHGSRAVELLERLLAR